MRVVFHDATLAHLAWLQFKLGFHQHEQLARGLEQMHHARQHQGE
jgi:hypothetical protein